MQQSFKKSLKKRAEMGVGTLIIFIAMLLVAAVAAGVLIQTAGSLQEKALSTGQQAKSQIATNLKVVEISATDGRTRSLTDFSQLVKLAPGSDPIKLSQLILTFNTYRKTATLNYRGVNGTVTNDNSGYSTWVEQEMGSLRKFNETNSGPITFAWSSSDFDLDGDTINDNVTVCRNGPGICDPAHNDFYLAFNISSTDTKVYVPLYAADGSTPADVSSSPQPLGNVRTPVGTYGFINTRGSTAAAWTLSAGQLITFINETVLDVDFDDDAQADYLALNDTHAIFVLSTAGEIPISLGMDLRTPGPISTSDTVEKDGTRYAIVEISGTTDTIHSIPENVTFEITPTRYGQGYFVAEYIEQGNNFVAGNIQRGDLVRFHFEAPEEVGEDVEIRINLIPKVGTPTMSKFATPSVISTERVYLYP